MYDSILLPTDGSDPADAAAEAAITLAGRFDADLHVVHVRDVGALPPSVDEADVADLGAVGESAVTAVTDRAADAGVTATRAVIEDDGPVHETILAYADKHGVDCLVMGTHGRTGLDRVILGSVAEETLRASPVPVLTVHEGTAVTGDFGSILVPTDGSAAAEAAASHAIDLAATTGAALHVVHVVDVPVSDAGLTAGAVLDALEEAGQRAIDRVLTLAKAADVSTIEASVLSGTPYRAIVDYADDQGIDCIVMGTHGRSGLERYLLGSVTERVIRLSGVPVLATGE